MRIIKLHAENVKRIKVVDITPEGAIVEIGGRNGQGKSSVLDAIEYALGGKPSAPEPVRRGAEGAEIITTLGNGEAELIVRRHWTSKGETHLTVDRPDGARMKGPQAVLDTLFGALTFDPLAFARMKPAQQADTLRALVGLDLEAFDGKRQRLYDERRDVGRRRHEVRGQLAGLPALPADLPNERVSIAETVSQLDAINEEIQSARSKAKQADLHRHHAREAREEIDVLEKQIAILRDRAANHTKDAERLDAELLAKPQADMEARASEVRSIVATAEQTNRAIDAREQRVKVAARVDELSGKYEDMTAQIDKIDADKQAAIAAAKFPLNGLGLGAAGVTFGDIPFEQLSQAEQIRVSVSIAMAMKPKLRVMLVREGSLLDAESMAALAKAADESGCQVWVERVGEQGQVVIEDGAVVGADTEAVTP